MVKRKEMVAILHMLLDCFVSKSPVGFSNSMICPKNAPEWPLKAPNFVYIGHCQFQTKNRPYLRLHTSKCTCEAPLPSQPPISCGFHFSELPKRTPRSLYRGHGLRQGARGSSKTWVPKKNKTLRAKKGGGAFFKNDPRPCGMPNQVFYGTFWVSGGPFWASENPKVF